MPVTKNDDPVVDLGTNTYNGPSEPEVFGNPDDDGTATDLGTGAYPGPGKPETWDWGDESAPVDNVVGVTEPETVYEWPAEAPAETTTKKTASKKK